MLVPVVQTRMKERSFPHRTVINGDNRVRFGIVATAARQRQIFQRGEAAQRKRNDMFNLENVG